ncbi:unnamed protein product [Gadus morhua 'NCC']
MDTALLAINEKTHSIGTASLSFFVIVLDFSVVYWVPQGSIVDPILFPPRSSSLPSKNWVFQALHSTCLHPTSRITLEPLSDPYSLSAGVSQGYIGGTLLFSL